MPEKSIRRRTFVYFTTAILVITLAFGSLVYVYFSNALRERIETDQLYATEQTAKSMEAVRMSIKQIAYYLCCSETLPAWVINQGGYSVSQAEALLSRDFTLHTGTPTAPLMQSAYAALLVDPQFPLASAIGGRPFSLGTVTRQHIYNAAQAEDARWYRETAARKGQIYAFLDPANERSVFFSHQLRNIYVADPRYDEVLGVVLYAMPRTRMLSILNNAQVTAHTAALFLFEDAVLSSTAPELFPVNEGIPGLPEPGKIARLTLDGRAYAASCAELSGGWKVALLVPAAEMNRHFWDFLPLLALFIAALLVVGLVLSDLFSRRLTRPILTLAGVMAPAQHTGQLLSPAPAPDTRDEIALLYQSYNAMARRIQALTEQNAAEEEEKRAAELRALQAQINPHFIYNTLDSVACIALLSGEDDIVTMVTSLIDLLKYSIQFSRATVTLREEITYLERYVQIQQLRYTDGFDFACDVPAEYDNVSISQIILQPLVENALFHAVRPRGKLEIRLYCQEEGQTLRLHVTDNGSDADAAELNRILAGAQAGEHYGIGIRNVDQRIRLHMGEAYGLHYEPLPSGGLDAIVTIPLHFD